MLFLLGCFCGLTSFMVFYYLRIMPLIKVEKKQAIHDYVQFLYDNKMLNEKAIKALKIDTATKQYMWKLREKDRA